MSKTIAHQGMVKLRDAVTETRSVEVVVKTALWAFRCDHCGALFRPVQEGEHCKIYGKFTGAATSAQGYMNNNFYARICSFSCAHQLMQGAWADMDAFAPYAEAGATLAYAEAKIVPVLMEDDLVNIWEQN